MLTGIDFAKVSEFLVSPHKTGDSVTVSFDADSARIQLVVPAQALPEEFRQEGAYKRRGDRWIRVLRVDGNEAIKALQALFAKE
jgi:hypothetical protein